ncbi:pyridoxal phosphate-dependent aminotransferase [Hymenobacter rubripertinctus]|uniref:Aminotransferase n=1 Tax=Hymenobacter rubripertinctus TaxID=2029981 RepID=A0A418QWM9_9BACT|nr:aminotransferase class I/II-fold pyridoxal phosphate-dependent enzyme [Hymenobacter rubripertinctus]RIY09551.1 aminotransferase class I/II-fold pyridoxal phosphate-dependent enzyme [Hymenobacter rubripertinctus]
MLYGHGDDGYRHAHQVVADFSTNVWYGGEPAGLKDYVFGQWATVNRYPEVLAESLAARIAAHHGLRSGQVLMSSGTTESIYLLAQAWGGSRTTIVTPAFAEYEDAARLHGHQLTFRAWEHLCSGPPLAADLVFICNPNNPTGSVLREAEVVELLTRNPHTVFVLDEAFIEFTTSIATTLPLLSRFSNLVILRSMTKAYAIPGLRLGYVAAPESLIIRLIRGKAPWTVSALAAAAGHFLFEHFAAVQPPTAQLLTDRATFAAQLAGNNALEIQPSHTHYFVGQLRRGTAANLKTWLLAHHGLLIRDAANFRGLTPAHFRLCTRPPAENQLLINALREWTALPA